MSEQTQAQPTEAELRAYEEELSRITTSQLVVQATASLLNVGGRRLGLGEGAEHERDLDQVRDAIDAVMGLLPILERRMGQAEARPLRDALAQLQMAYARLAQAEPAGGAQAGAASQTAGGSQAAQTTQAGQATQTADEEQDGQKSASEAPAGAGSAGGSADEEGSAGSSSQGPGPAERSGRLWVPGR